MAAPPVGVTVLHERGGPGTAQQGQYSIAEAAFSSYLQFPILQAMQTRGGETHAMEAREDSKGPAQKTAFAAGECCTCPRAAPKSAPAGIKRQVVALLHESFTTFQIGLQVFWVGYQGSHVRLMIISLASMMPVSK